MGGPVGADKGAVVLPPLDAVGAECAHDGSAVGGGAAAEPEGHVAGVALAPSPAGEPVDAVPRDGNHAVAEAGAAAPAGRRN